MIESAVTPNELHFVRNHGGIPEIDEAAYFFDVGGLVNEPKRITLAELKNEKLFPRQSNIVTIQCSGTRRLEQIALYPGEGDELINAPVRIPTGMHKHIVSDYDCELMVRVL